IFPPDGRTIPEIALMIDDFPAPFAPTSVTRVPAATSKETPRTASTRPYETDRSCTLSSGSVIVLLRSRRLRRGDGCRSIRLTLIRRTQIRLDHAFVGGDLGGGAVGENLAEVQHDDVIAGVQH